MYKNFKKLLTIFMVSMMWTQLGYTEGFEAERAPTDTDISTKDTLDYLTKEKAAFAESRKQNFITNMKIKHDLTDESSDEDINNAYNKERTSYYKSEGLFKAEPKEKSNYSIDNFNDYRDIHLKEVQTARRKKIAREAAEKAVQEGARQQVERKNKIFTTEELEALTSEEIKDLTPKQIAEFKPEQLKVLFTKDLSTEQIQAIKPEVLAKAIEGSFASRAAQFKPFGKNKIQTLPDSFVDALSPEQAKAILDMHDGRFTFSHMKDYFDKESIAKLKNLADAAKSGSSTVQIAKARNVIIDLVKNPELIKYKYKIATFEQLSTADKETVANDFTRAINEEESKYFKNTTKINNLKNALRSFVDDYITPSLNKNEVALNLYINSKNVIKILDVSRPLTGQISDLSRGLTETELSDALNARLNSPNNAVNLSTVNPDFIKYIDISALSDTQIKAFTDAQIKALTSDQIKAITSDQIKALTSDQISALTPDQVKALTPEQIAKLTADQTSKMSLLQVVSLMGKLKDLSDDQLKEILNTSNNSEIRNGIYNIKPSLGTVAIPSEPTFIINPEINKQFKSQVELLNKLTSNNAESIIPEINKTSNQALLKISQDINELETSRKNSIKLLNIYLKEQNKPFLENNATPEEINKAYRSIVVSYSPDKLSPNTPQEERDAKGNISKQINEAHTNLTKDIPNAIKELTTATQEQEQILQQIKNNPNISTNNKQNIIETIALIQTKKAQEKNLNPFAQTSSTGLVNTNSDFSIYSSLQQNPQDGNNQSKTTPEKNLGFGNLTTPNKDKALTQPENKGETKKINSKK